LNEKTNLISLDFVGGRDNMNLGDFKFETIPCEPIKCHSECCPVCKGSGQVPNYYYSGMTTTGSNITETCKSCNGRGYVIVPNNQDTK
jgi:hypothetical protein